MTGEGAFVTITELVNVWRPLTTAERAHAVQLLEAAGAKIREEYRTAHGVDIAGDSPAARTVSIEMVRTAIQTGAYIGHIQYTRIEGQRQKSGTLVNPGGALVLTDYHRTQLGLPISAGPSYHFDGCL
ncbi:head-to-tail connector complex protein [Gordonia phage GEazy]|nr:head-to-tail connector complex protein [Gordonia phage GEazy]QDF16721.1 head-to-tail adaptor [Gordonia phage HannahD]